MQRSSSVQRDINAVPHVMFADRKDDPAGWIESREQVGRELFVAWSTVKVVREELAHCYRVHGVNHLQECKKIREEYGRLIKDPNFGMLRVCFVSISFVHSQMSNHIFATADDVCST